MVEQHSRVPGPLQQKPVLIGLFAALALVASVGTVFVLGGGVDQLVWALAVGVVAGGAVVGVYALGQYGGVPHSHGVAMAGIIFGVFLLAAIVAELLHSSGQVSNQVIGLGLFGAVIGSGVILLLTAFADVRTRRS
jgi:hypothetical protein